MKRRTKLLLISIRNCWQKRESSDKKLADFQDQISTLKADAAEFKAGIVDLDNKYNAIYQENIALQADKRALEDEAKAGVINNENSGGQILRTLKSLSTDQVKFACQTVVTGDRTVHFCLGTANGCQNTNLRVWGSNPYTSDSGYCAASLHSGAINEQGGFVEIKKEPGYSNYNGTSSNGVTTLSYGQYPTSVSITNVNSHSS